MIHPKFFHIKIEQPVATFHFLAISIFVLEIRENIP